jgi:glycosyltransferase involved in cell wall biosynthesis
MSAMKKLSIVIPCYYNQDNVAITFNAIKTELDQVADELAFEVIFVDDGSKDNTYQALLALKDKYPAIVKVIKLVKNVGGYTAIMAGIKHASTADCLTIISADMQDPPEMIRTMYEAWKKGSKLVIGQRVKRDDGMINDLFSNTFYFFLRRFVPDFIPKGGFDFVFFDRDLRDHLISINEKNTNPLYLLAWMGYPYICIPYERRKREIGKSRWTFQKKLKLLIDSFISFTYSPVRLISLLGIFLGLASFLYMIFIVYAKLSGAIGVEGWSTLMIVILLVSAFQMMAIGVLGEYVWRCLDAVRDRPQYIIEKTHD